MILPKLNIDKNSQFKVLVFRNGDIGNTVVSEPFFPILKEMYPNVIIHGVFDKIGSQLFHANPYIDEVFTFNKNRDSFKAKVQLVKKWRKEKYLISFHLKSGITNELMAFLSGIPYRIGFPLKGSLQFVNTKIIKRKEILHHFENGRYLLSIFGREIPSKLPQLYSSKTSTEQIEKLLTEQNLGKNKYVVLHPTGKTMKKGNWSIAYYSDLINEIIKRFNIPVIIIGIPNELEEIKSLIRPRENLQYYFEDNIILKSELIKNSKYFIGNDSGPFHIAECWQVPSVVLYKKNDDGYKRWYPLNKEKSLPIFIPDLSEKKEITNKVFNFLDQWNK